MALKLGKNSLYSPLEVIAIGDIHADFSKLSRLINKLLPLPKDSHLVFTGDLLDRGQDLFLVLDLLKELKRQYPSQVFFLLGNHDNSLINFLNPKDHWMYRTNVKLWLNKWGGQITKDQLSNKYGETPEEIKQGLINDGYLSIFESMILYYETEKEFISHAPVDAFMGLMYLDKMDEDLEDHTKALTLLEGFADSLEHKLYSTFTEEITFRIPNWENLKIEKLFISGHQSSGNKEPRLKDNRVFLDVVGEELFAYSSKFGIISSM